MTFPCFVGEDFPVNLWLPAVLLCDHFTVISCGIFYLYFVLLVSIPIEINLIMNEASSYTKSHKGKLECLTWPASACCLVWGSADYHTRQDRSVSFKSLSLTFHTDTYMVCQPSALKLCGNTQKLWLYKYVMNFKVLIEIILKKYYMNYVTFFSNFIVMWLFWFDINRHWNMKLQSKTVH